MTPALASLSFSGIVRRDDQDRDVFQVRQLTRRRGLRPAAHQIGLVRLVPPREGKVLAGAARLAHRHGRHRAQSSCS
jgi:hypothetical protein